LWIFENTLQDECQYNGTQPYWDWSLDHPEKGGDMATSPVWHPTLGYGGNGNWTKRDAQGRRGATIYDGCVLDGAFKDYQLHLGIGSKTAYNPRCLKRDFHLPMMVKSASTKYVINPILATASYDEFQNLNVPSEDSPFGPHSLGHLGVGGEVSKSSKGV
jgi:tyrosinase